MATTSADALFIDTNILVYANVSSAPFHEKSRTRILEAREAGITLWISRQVIREFVATRTRPQEFLRPLTAGQAAERVRQFECYFKVADDNSAVTEQLMGLVRDFDVRGKQVHDANVVATMRAHGIKCLLTNNVKDFRRYENSIVVQRI